MREKESIFEVSESYGNHNRHATKCRHSIHIGRPICMSLACVPINECRPSNPVDWIHTNGPRNRCTVVQQLSHWRKSAPEPDPIGVNLNRNSLPPPSSFPSIYLRTTRSTMCAVSSFHSFRLWVETSQFFFLLDYTRVVCACVLIISYIACA